VWLLIAQLWSLRGVHSQIYVIIWGLFFGSIGDILLLFGVFEGGALAFLIGHILDVVGFIGLARDIGENRANMRDVLRQEPLFIGIWIVLITFSFWSISFINQSLTPSDPIQYVLDVYGTVLVLLTMGGFFFFFVTADVSDTIRKAGLLIMFGCLVFFVSDNTLAHGKYDKSYQKIISASLNSYFIMVTYYAAQWLIAKGTFLVAVHFSETKGEYVI
jgi:uncharacterized membrane protein YhhN